MLLATFSAPTLLQEPPGASRSVRGTGYVSAPLKLPQASRRRINSPDAGYLENLGDSYLARFQRLDELHDLEKAIECQAKAALLTPDSHPDKPGRLDSLGVSYRTRFRRLGELPDLNKAIECQAEAVSLSPDGRPAKSVCLNNLGISYSALFERLGELSDLQKAIECQAQAVWLTPDDHSNKPVYINNLGNSHLARFRRLGELLDLSKAIEHQAQAISLIPVGHPAKPAYLNNFGNSYWTRFKRLGKLPDLNKAIEYQANAVLLTPDGHPDKLVYLNNLGDSYSTRFHCLGELPDLSKAIKCQAEALSLTPDGHPHKPAWLHSLGNSYSTRFGRLGKLPDLSKAIERLEQAIALTPDGHPHKLAVFSNLGNSYLTQFERLGELSDLNKALEYQAQAVLLTPDGYPEKPVTLCNLGISFFTRFQRLGELPDLSKAIECQAGAVSLTADDHPDKPQYLSNLGASFLTQNRFRCPGELPNLDKAMECQEQAVWLTPDGHPDKPGRLGSLGNSYSTRFEHLGEPLDLNKAIECHAMAVSLTPDDHPDKPHYLNNLGNSHWNRFHQLTDLSDLQKAIECQKQAVSLTPDGHPGKPGRLSNLGFSYRTRFKRLGGISDLRSAEELFSMSSQSTTGPPSVRFRACRQWARLSSFDVTFSPFPAYKQAMSLIPQLVWIGTTISHRYELVAEVSSFATEAAAYAISTGEYRLALEWLEAGRSIVWGQIIQLRMPLEELSSHNPKLAEELTSVGRQLEQAGFRSSLPSSLDISDSDLGQEENTHAKLALQWDELLMEIRLTPGFEDFLCTPSADRLLSAAKAHPIVIINLHNSHCDALILQTDGNTISHVGLSNFSSQDAVSACSFVFSQVRDRKVGKRLTPPGPYHHSLETLWLGMIKPVLDSLGYARKLPVEQLPQITWCTTGLLSFLPLHTARGPDESQPGAFDLVISSYTPTLGALLSSQAINLSSPCGIVAIGQENTRGLDSLPGTTRELTVIRGRAESSCYLQLENDEATVEQVLDAMDQFSWVHMACHGSQDTHDPTKSAFHLHDGNLTLADITKRSFTNKGLAFLSACQTATGNENMPDEAVHLAAGMLMAGYPSVIGTMWSIADADGPKVADLVYAELLKDGKMDHANAARALHRAVAQLREKAGVDRIERWAPFIHIGV